MLKSTTHEKTKTSYTSNSPWFSNNYIINTGSHCIAANPRFSLSLLLFNLKNEKLRVQCVVNRDKKCVIQISRLLLIQCFVQSHSWWIVSANTVARKINHSQSLDRCLFLCNSELTFLCLFYHHHIRFRSFPSEKKHCTAQILTRKQNSRISSKQINTFFLNLAKRGLKLFDKCQNIFVTSSMFRHNFLEHVRVFKPWNLVFRPLFFAVFREFTFSYFHIVTNIAWTCCDRYHVVHRDSISKEFR